MHVTKSKSLLETQETVAMVTWFEASAIRHLFFRILSRTHLLLKISHERVCLIASEREGVFQHIQSREESLILLGFQAYWRVVYLLGVYPAARFRRVLFRCCITSGSET